MSPSDESFSYETVRGVFECCPPIVIDPKREFQSINIAEYEKRMKNMTLSNGNDDVLKSCQISNPL